MAVKSYAQVGEDLQIAYLLGRNKGIHYIDVGCLWPMKLSNTYFFYERGGSGLCIDANPSARVEYETARPRDTFLNVGLSDNPGQLDYYSYTNPVFNTFSPDRARFVQKKSAKRTGRDLVEIVEIPVTTLDDAIKQTAFAERCDGRLDFITIDVEGLEREVIAGFSFDCLRPRLLICEHIRRRREEMPVEGSPLVADLARHGYWLAAYTGHDAYFLDAGGESARR